MEIRDPETARAWLRAWGGKPRRGILLAAIDGVAMAASLSQPRARKRLEGALRVLKGAQ